MSHVASIEFEGRELPMLKRAVRKRGGDWREGQTTHAWWGTFLGDSSGMRNSAFDQGIDPTTYGKCTHAIGIPGKSGRNGSSGPWEIGVVVNPDGSFRLQYDNYGSAGRELEALFGKDLQELYQSYLAEVTLDELQKDGFRLAETITPDGAIELIATR